jgi:septum formation protein
MRHKFIYLASQSPRRQGLLQQIGVQFKLLLPTEDEDAEALEVPAVNEEASAYTQRVTIAKSMAALARWQKAHQKDPQLQWAPIMCADTTVSLPGSPLTEILGKPKDADDAKRMLRSLSGQSHWVYTAVAITSEADLPPKCFIQKSELEFETLTDDQIKSYIASGECFGKAGAYGIQGLAASFIKRIDGSYSSIMGLPLFETAKLLEQAHVDFGLKSYESRNTN